VAHGVPVYLLDWGRPGPEDAELTLGELVDELLPRAIKRATRHARAAGWLGADELPDALGYCVGGTFLSISLSRNAGLAGRMGLLAAPIDFHKSGRLAVWARPETFPLDDIIDGLGNFPKALMKDSFAWLKPAGQISKWKTLADKFDQTDFQDTWAAMEQWSDDGVDFPGEAYRAYVRGCYFENALVKGGWTLDGRPVNLGSATIPAHVWAASSDHICTPDAAFGLKEAWGGPVTTELVKGGHVGVCIGRAFPASLIKWIDA
jgi:polyhydroxyalkanoate synthase